MFECGEVFRVAGCSWEVILTLEKGTLVSRMTITNHSGKDQPCLYWWTCIAVPQQWRDRVMMAPGEFLHHAMFRQGYEFDQWPMPNCGAASDPRARMSSAALKSPTLERCANSPKKDSL